MALVTCERDGPVAVLTLNRPAQRNAVSAALLDELVQALAVLAADADLRAIVLRGAGPDFCAGADVGELAEARTGPSGIEYGLQLEGALHDIAEHPVPVIAEIQGAALGAGCQIAVACDLAVAASDARLGIPSSRLGVLITFENVERLVLSLGPKRAGEILFTGRAVSGEVAAAWGLVNQAVPAEDLRETVHAMAVAVADGAPISIRGSKRGIRAVMQKLSVDRFAEGHRAAEFDMLAAQALASDDLEEGLRAFAQRRAPRFRGT
jgi:enoyl-CoA hydratase/carnithine racemase